MSNWRCPVCGYDETGCHPDKTIREESLTWAPGKVLIFMAGGNRQHWSHPQHYGLVGTDDADMTRRVAEHFKVPGGAEALNAKWERWRTVK